LPGYYGGTTALELALSHPEIVLALLEGGARPESRELLSAVYDKNDTLVEALLRAGADVNTRDTQGRTALILAAEKSGSDKAAAAIVRRLIAAGSDVNARDQQGRTALMMYGSEEVTRALLAAGADPTLKDSQGLATVQRYRPGDPSGDLIRRAIERTDRSRN
jgi:ankyrin repeat protein